jgi:hypothetical protein
LDWAAKRGMTRTWVEAQIEEFLAYWTDTGERRKSWDATFINRLQARQPKDEAHEPEPRLADKDYLTGATRSIRSPGSTPPLSAEELAAFSQREAVKLAAERRLAAQAELERAVGRSGVSRRFLDRPFENYLAVTPGQHQALGVCG